MKAKQDLRKEWGSLSSFFPKLAVILDQGRMRSEGRQKEKAKEDQMLTRTYSHTYLLINPPIHTHTLSLIRILSHTHSPSLYLAHTLSYIHLHQAPAVRISFEV